ncbi:MAG: ABC transporter substrate-binding protein, partial [Silvibacterium sp.]
MSNSCGRALSLALFVFAAFLAGCGHRTPPANSITMLIENSPASLDPRIGTDSQAERIDPLIFDSLV